MTYTSINFIHGDIQIIKYNFDHRSIIQSLDSFKIVTMSLDRNHPVFRGHPLSDKVPLLHRSRFLDDEIGSRTYKWKYRRYICILGRQGTGRRSLAKRFFQDRGELRVDGNWWLRGLIRLPDHGPLPRGQIDLLIRIVPAPEEDLPFRGSRRLMMAVGMHGNVGLLIFAFNCSRVRDLQQVPYYGLFSGFINRNVVSYFVVGTKCDLRLPESENQAPHNQFMNEEEINEAVKSVFYNVPILPPAYIECSVKEDIKVASVINTALDNIL